MALIISILVGLLFTAGLFLIMKRNILEVLLGTLLLSHGVNLLLIAMGGWAPDGKPPILESGESLPPSAYADPLPHALILTAIVIAFGITSFLVVIVLRGFEETNSSEFGETGRGEGEP